MPVPTNKKKRKNANVDENNTNQVTENAKALEDLARQVDWTYLGKAYAVCFAALAASIFILIFLIDLATSLV